MMKQTFLNLLIGLSKEDAIRKVQDEGFIADVVKPDTFVAAVAVRDHVVLYIQDNHVIAARAGDPLQVYD